MYFKTDRGPIQVKPEAMIARDAAMMQAQAPLPVEEIPWYKNMYIVGGIVLLIAVIVYAMCQMKNKRKY